jgi:hypothetical protein
VSKKSEKVACSTLAANQSMTSADSFASLQLGALWVSVQFQQWALTGLSSGSSVGL